MHDPGLRLAKVAAVYPDGHSVDVVFYDDGSRAANVQVLSGSASTSTGFHDLPSPHLAPDGDPWSPQESKTRDMIAVIGFVRGMPVVFGFLFPQVNQMLFSDQNRMVYRHASGVYFTISASGDTEICHPSGAFARFGASPGHEDLSGRDFDGKWNIPASAPVSIRVEQAGGVASLTIDPAGNVVLDHDGSLTTTTGGTATVTSAGALVINAPSVTINAPSVTINGQLTQGTGSNGGGCTLLGPVNVTNDVVAGGKSLIHHLHGGVTAGGANTGQPV